MDAEGRVELCLNKTLDGLEFAYTSGSQAGFTETESWHGSIRDETTLDHGWGHDMDVQDEVEGAYWRCGVLRV